MPTTSPIRVANQAVEPIHPAACHALAELGLCMEGDRHRLLAMCKAAKAAGAWGVKVQLLHPDRIASPDAPVYWTDRLGNRTQREAFARSQPLPYDAFAKAREWCRANALAFVATPFDDDAVKACADLDVDAIKIASGDITNPALVGFAASVCAGRGIPLIISTGAATLDEVADVVGDVLYRKGPDTVWLACTLSYPTPLAEAHLARIGTLARLVSEAAETLGPDGPAAAVGYSDHTLDDFTSLGAACAGAALVEKHVSDGAAKDTPDNDMALDMAGLASYVINAEAGARLRGEPGLYTHAVEDAARAGARRSLAATADLPAGHTLSPGDLTALRPGTGIEPGLAGAVLGMVLARPVSAGALLRSDDLATPGR